jgi:hypothetical protein
VFATSDRVVYALHPTDQDMRGNVVKSPAQKGMVINIGAVLATLRKLMAFEMTIAEWIGTAVLAAIPYLMIGVIWSATHSGHVGGLTAIERTLSFLGSTVSWPVLLFSDVCMT